MSVKDFKVGQKIWVEMIGNEARRRKSEDCIDEWEITHVGRKLLKAGKRSGDKIYYETAFEYNDCYGRFAQRDNCCVNYILYATRQELEEEQEKERKFFEIRNRLKYGSQDDITLNQIRKIHGILFPKK